MTRCNPSKRFSILAASLALLLLLLMASMLCAVGVYQKPPKEVLDILNAPPTPTLLVSPAKDRVLLITTLRYPPISDLSQPMLRIAGLRLNPKTNGPHHPSRHVAYTLKWIDTGKEVKVVVPPSAYLSMPEWSGDGKYFAFSNTTSSGIELWVGDGTTGAVHKMAGVVLNAAYGDAIQWMPDNKTLLVQTIAAGRGKPPEEAWSRKAPSSRRVPASPPPFAPMKISSKARTTRIFSITTARHSLRLWISRPEKLLRSESPACLPTFQYRRMANCSS